MEGRKGLGLGLYICKELVTRQGGQIWAKSTMGQGSIFSVTLPIFSLPTLIAPAFRKEGRSNGPVTLVVTEIGSQSGWLSEDVRSEQSQGVREVLQRCLHSHLDVLLPKMGVAGAVGLFFLVAITDAIGGEAISKRIREQLHDHVQQADLTLSTSYHCLAPAKRQAGESIEGFLEALASGVQELINVEIESRRTVNG